jgi:hypothetical protein
MISTKNKILFLFFLLLAITGSVQTTFALTQSTSVGVNVVVPAFSSGPSSGGGGGGGGGNYAGGGGSPGSDTTTPPGNTPEPPPTNPPPENPPPTETPGQEVPTNNNQPPSTIPTETPGSTPNDGNGQAQDSTTPVFITVQSSGATREVYTVGNEAVSLPTFAGTASFQGETNLLLSTITLTISGAQTLKDQITSTAAGTWSWTSSNTLPEGIYTITVRITDNTFSSMSGSASYTFAVKYPVTPEKNILEQLVSELPLTSVPLPDIVIQARQNKIIIKTIQEVSAPLSQAVVVVGGGGVVAAAAAANAGLAAGIQQVVQVISNLRFYLLGLFRFKKRTPWGRVTYKHSGQPVSGASAQVYDASFNKLKDSQITDKLGRFSALVAPGNYYVKIFKPGFQVARSGTLTITPGNSSLNLELVLEPLEDTRASNAGYGISIWTKLQQLLTKLNPYILVAGTMISVLNALIVPSTLNQAILVIYIGIDIFQFYLLSTAVNPYGSIVDAAGKPLTLSVVRIFNLDSQTLMATKVTDEQGRFNFLVDPGTYYVTVTKVGFKPHISEPIAIKKADILKLNITLQSV